MKAPNTMDSFQMLQKMVTRPCIIIAIIMSTAIKIAVSTNSYMKFRSSEKILLNVISTLFFIFWLLTFWKLYSWHYAISPHTSSVVIMKSKIKSFVCVSYFIHKCSFFSLVYNIVSTNFGLK